MALPAQARVPSAGRGQAPARAAAKAQAKRHADSKAERHAGSHARGAYCDLERLLGLRFAAANLDLGRRRRALNALAGANRANFRGRGIDFEEVRGYQPGDDIRAIDWRVTARTGSAHTKLFREERERPVLVTIDQRPAMFFGSRQCCKSVLAAELGAIIAWAAADGSDRVGGLVFGAGGQREVRPRRSRRSLLGLLSHLAELNQALPGPPRALPDAMSFADAMAELRRIAKPGSSVYLISDFSDALEPRALEQVYQLSRHAEITALHCSDPLERELPRQGDYSVTDGREHLRLDTGGAALRERFAAQFAAGLEALKREYGRVGIPVIECETTRAPLETLHGMYGGPRAAGGRGI